MTVDDVEEQVASAQLGKFAVTFYPLDIAHIIYDNVFYQIYEEDCLNAWIVTWKGSGEAPPGIVAAYNYRRADHDVARLVEQLYLTLTKATTDEILRYAKAPEANPYPAIQPPVGPITCGHNPWLEARYVKNIRMIDGEWVWDEPDFPAIRKRLEKKGL